MSNNIFYGKRFLLLCRQHFIHNTNFLVLSTVGYVGVVFIVLSIAQVSNDVRPHELELFQAFLIGFVTVFGIIHAGHSFPAFRSKESTINYIMLPASVAEKFLFEFISRIATTLLILPLLYWVTFHLQGYFFNIFTDEIFRPIGLEYLVTMEVPEGYHLLIYTLVSAGVLLALVLAFTGATMFTKQPLVKSLFAIAVIVMFFISYSYVVVMYLGVGKYNPPATMFLVPTDEDNVLKLMSFAFIATTMIMLCVAFMKLKEREV